MKELGRIERLFETLQGGLKEELRIEGIKDIESANIYLKGFIERYNKKFSVKLEKSYSHLLGKKFLMIF